MVTRIDSLQNSCDESLHTRTEPNGSHILIVVSVDYMLLAEDDQKALRHRYDCIEKKVYLLVEESATEILGPNI